jgi:ABC-type transport system involved in cytochrome bd biosynthesis fused ATPase/permease subunit
VLSLAVAIGAVQAFALGRGVARYLERLALHDVALSTLGKLRLFLYDTLEPLVPGGLGASRSGSVLSAFVTDCEVIVDALAKTLGAAIDVTSSVLLGVLLALLVDPAASAALAAGTLLVVLAAAGIARFGRAAAKAETDLRAELADAVVETVRSAPELVVYGRHDLVTAQLEHVRARASSAGTKRALATGLGRAAVACCSTATLVAVVVLGLTAHDAHRLSGVLLAVLIFDSLAVLETGTGLPGALAGLAAGDAAVARLQLLTKLKPPVSDSDEESRATQSTRVLTSGVPHQGARVPPTFDSVAESPADTARSAVRLGTSGTSSPATSFREVDEKRETDERETDKKEAALERAHVLGSDGARLLDDVTLSVGACHRLALVGHSGAGKTSVIYTLLHFLECSSGCATLGGVDVRLLGREQLARRIGWLPEETHVFAATLASNLRLADPGATDERCAEVLERVGLSGWLESLPEGLSTGLGAGGRALSAGERQRLGMARALLAGGSVLLFDEPTAHLDPASAAHLLPELLDAADHLAVLVTSHDPDISHHVDELVTLDAGRVCETTKGRRYLTGENAFTRSHDTEDDGSDATGH